jgi:hypothetical protein
MPGRSRPAGVDSARIVFGRNDCSGEASNRCGRRAGRVVVPGARSACDVSRRRIQRHLGQQLTGRRIAYRPRVARVGRPLGGAARDVVSIGATELGQCGTVVDAIVGTQAAQIPLPGVDLDGIDGPAPAIRAT